MKLTVDPKADALYLRLNDAQIADSEQVASGVILDYDAQDNVVGMEMLHLSKRARKADLQRLLFERGCYFFRTPRGHARIAAVNTSQAI